LGLKNKLTKTLKALAIRAKYRLANAFSVSTLFFTSFPRVEATHGLQLANAFGVEAKNH
jgi:hypothetical protein